MCWLVVLPRSRLQRVCLRFLRSRAHNARGHTRPDRLTQLPDRAWTGTGIGIHIGTPFSPHTPAPTPARNIFPLVLSRAAMAATTLHLESGIAGASAACTGDGVPSAVETRVTDQHNGTAEALASSVPGRDARTHNGADIQSLRDQLTTTQRQMYYLYRPLFRFATCICCHFQPSSLDILGYTNINLVWQTRLSSLSKCEVNTHSTISRPIDFGRFLRCRRPLLKVGSHNFILSHKKATI